MDLENCACRFREMLEKTQSKVAMLSTKFSDLMGKNTILIGVANDLPDNFN